jgi:hypothetical protein
VGATSTWRTARKNGRARVGECAVSDTHAHMRDRRDRSEATVSEAKPAG